MISIRELRNIERRQIRARKRLIKRQMEKVNNQKKRKEKKRKELIKKQKKRNPSKNLKRLQTKKALNHYHERMLKLSIEKKKKMVSNLVHTVVTENKYNPGITPISTIEHPPMYQTPIIPIEPKEIVRQIYLRDRLHYLQENYHLH